MEIIRKLKSGHLITLDHFREENWSPFTRKVVDCLAVLLIGATFILLLWGTP